MKKILAFLLAIIVLAAFTTAAFALSVLAPSRDVTLEGRVEYVANHEKDLVNEKVLVNESWYRFRVEKSNVNDIHPNEVLKIIEDRGRAVEFLKKNKQYRLFVKEVIYSAKKKRFFLIKAESLIRFLPIAFFFLFLAYPIYLLIRFIIWAIKTLRAK